MSAGPSSSAQPLRASATSPLEGGPSFSLGNRLTRLAWNVAWLLLASWTPPQLHPWRRALLRAFGAKMGPRSDVRGSARIWYPPHLEMGERTLLAARVNCYNMAPIRLDRGALVSQGAHLCAGSHDIDDPAFQLIAAPIVIGEGAWVAAEAFVGPGVEIGARAVLGARAVAMRSIPPAAIAVGNPARPLARQRR